MLGLIAAPICALAQQEIMDDSIDLAKIGYQTGIVTEVSGHEVWARFPLPVKIGQRVEFLFFSDGTRPVAQGKVEWVSPLKPYDCLILDVKSITNSYPMNDNDDLWAIDEFFNKTVKTPERGVKYGVTGYLALNMPARTEAPGLKGSAQDAVEPVHAWIAALRKRSNKTATEIADAAERSLVTEAEDQPEPVAVENGERSALPPLVYVPGPGNEYVNYSVLALNLRRFKSLSDMDTVTRRIYLRLIETIQYHSPGTHLPTDILNQKSNTVVGGAGGPAGP
jgi:hypothetical protein